MGYSFEVVCNPGLENKAADALSRTPRIVHLNQISAPTLLDLVVSQEEEKRDQYLQEIQKKIERTKSESSKLFSTARGIEIQRKVGAVKNIRSTTHYHAYLS